MRVPGLLPSKGTSPLNCRSYQAFPRGCLCIVRIHFLRGGLPDSTRAPRFTLPPTQHTHTDLHRPLRRVFRASTR